MAEYTYYPDGRIKKQHLASGIQTLYTYDSDRKIATLTTKAKDGTVLLEYTYDYDGNDNQISREGSANSQTPGKTEYTYDCLQRLTEVTYPGGKTEQFEYDLAGNRILRREGERREEYYYDSRNRLKELLFHDNKEQGKETYTYDAHGNLLQTKIEGFREKERYQKRETYQYNAFQQAIRVEQTKDIIGSPVSIVQENSYDAEGMRYAIWENGRQTTFQTDGWNILEENSEEGNQKSLVWGNSLLASEEAENYHYYHKNEHGDIELLTEETGRITNRYQYEAFGGRIQAEEEERNRFRYSGEVEDELTGQYYLRARYYCPRVGRFTQEDSYRGDGLNLYAYCKNNPVFYIDPSGYETDNSGCSTDLKEKKDKENIEILHEFKFDTTSKFTEYQQKTIFELFDRKADEIVRAGLADEITLKDISKNLKKVEKKGTIQKQKSFKFEMQTIKLLFHNNIPIVEAGRQYNVKELGGTIGEIDVATEHFIIECFKPTTGRSKGAEDFEKYFHGDKRQPYINPKNKQVLLYADGDIDSQKASEIKKFGVSVITSKEKLLEVLLKGEKKIV